MQWLLECWDPNAVTHYFKSKPQFHTLSLKREGFLKRFAFVSSLISLLSLNWLITVIWPEVLTITHPCPRINLTKYGSLVLSLKRKHESLSIVFMALVIADRAWKAVKWKKNNPKWFGYFPEETLISQLLLVQACATVHFRSLYDTANQEAS